MRKKKMWRYYCDFCKKSGGSKYHMKLHEASCTNNPDRNCQMCDYGEGYQANLKELIKIIRASVYSFVDDWDCEIWTLGDGVTEKNVLDNLREKTTCPACLLSALRQSGVPFLFPSFDYKAEKKQLWVDYNDARAEEAVPYIVY